MSNQSPSAGRSLDSRVTAVESRLEGIEITLGEIKTFMSTAANNRQFTLAHLGVIVAILLGIGGVGAAYVNMVVAPLQDKSSASITDRDAMRAQQALNTKELSSLAKTDGQTLEMLREVETQVKGIYDIQNLRESHNKEIISLLWRKSFGEEYPNVPFFPQPKVMPDNSH